MLKVSSAGLKALRALEHAILRGEAALTHAHDKHVMVSVDVLALLLVEARASRDRLRQAAATEPSSVWSTDPGDG